MEVVEYWLSKPKKPATPNGSSSAFTTINDRAQNGWTDDTGYWHPPVPRREADMGEIIDIIEEDAMPKCDATIRHMIEVGRAWLQANPGKPATAYEVKQIMALAEPQHNALQQSKAICTLLVEFSGKK